MKEAVLSSPQLRFDQDRYDRVIAEKADRSLVYESVLQPETGDAYFVEAGQVIRLEQRHEVNQIADWWWITPDLELRQSANNTMALESNQYMSTFSRIWSGISGMRPLATMVADEAPADFSPPGFASHFWDFHCSPTWHQAGFPHLPAGHNACHVNAMQGFSRIPAVHEITDEAERRALVRQLAETANYQTFQPISWTTTEDDRLVGKGAPAPAVPHGTGVEFYAEVDAYVVISTCPWVDQAQAVGDQPAWPLYVSVWDTGIASGPAPVWQDWEGEFWAAAERGDKDLSVRTPDSY